MTSLRRRLIAVLSASILAGWLATAFFTWLDARRQLDQALGKDAEPLAQSVAEHLLHPLLVAVPLLGLAIWLSVGWGLAPLRALAEQVAARRADDLEPLAVEAPQEARPLVTALDGLFGRVRQLIERERRFTADAAHELRTPLAAIRTHAQVAQAATDEAGRRAALTGLIQGCDRAAHLVDQLLVLARLEAGPALETVRPAAVAAEVVAGCAPWAAQRGVEVGLSVADPAELRGNPQLVAVLLRNLVDNAVRYNRRGGHVAVAVAANTLVVEDDGPGIPADQRALAFARFHRSPGSREEGSGLGLSIVARIAELHGARVVLEDGPGGRGLRVAVVFPLSAV